MDERWIWAGAAIVGGFVAGALVGVMVRRLLDRPDRRVAVREIAGPLSVFAFWLLAGTGIVLAVAVSSPETLRPVPRDILDWLPNLALAGLLVIGGYGVGLTMSAAVGRALARASGARQRTLERIVRAVIFGGAAILALSQIGVDTTVLNILIAGLVFGVAGAAAGIAVVGGRRVADHVAAGRTLQHVLEVGAHVRLGEISGHVVELKIAHVVLDGPDGRVLVPYGAIMDAPIYFDPSPAAPTGALR